MTEEENTPLDPSADSTSDDEEDAEIEISERKLLWTVVAVLAVFAVVEGLTIVSWGSRIRRLEQQIQSPSIALSGGAGEAEAAPEPTVVSTPEEARAVTMRAVEAFATEKGLDEATAEKLRTLIEDSERMLEALPMREAAGEITNAERIQTLEREIAQREGAVRDLLGDELATELHAKIFVVVGGSDADGRVDAGPPRVPSGK